MDSTHVKDHRCSARKKEGTDADHRALPKRRHDQTPRPERRAPEAAPHPAHRRPGRRCRAAEALLEGLSRRTRIMADRAHETDAIRRRIEGQGAVPNIPPDLRRRT